MTAFMRIPGWVFALAAGLVFAGGAKEQAEKKVVVYSSVDEANAKKILDAFSADTGIKVSFVHISTGPAIARIKAAGSDVTAIKRLG